MKSHSMLPILLTMAFLVMLVNCISLVLNYTTSWSTAPLAIISTATITFVSLVMLCERDSPSGALSEQTMRTAISGTIVVVYLVLISYATFNFIPGQQSPIAGTLITSFTATVGVVVAFYFGASAYVQARSKGGKSGE